MTPYKIEINESVFEFSIDYEKYGKVFVSFTIPQHSDNENKSQVLDNIRTAFDLKNKLELIYNKIDWMCSYPINDSYVLQHSSREEWEALSKSIDSLFKEYSNVLPSEIGQECEHKKELCNKAILIYNEYENLDLQELKNEEEGIIYIIESDSLYKIGKTKNLKRRISELQKLSTNPLSLVFSKKLPGYHTIEKKLHIIFRKKHYVAEWFNLVDSDIKLIRNILC